MKMETITVSPGEDRVLLLFDAAATEAARGRVDDYLKAHNLSPRREYTEERDGKDYLVLLRALLPGAPPGRHGGDRREIRLSGTVEFRPIP